MDIQQPWDRRAVEDVGNSAAYMVSDLAGAVTGEISYVDCGFNITAL